MPKLSDVGLALLVFAGSVALRVAGEGHGHVTAASVALTALASLPLVARRRAPVAVFVATAVASVALRALEEPAGPPLGPTVALYFAVVAGPTRRLAVLAGALLIAQVAAMGLASDRFPATPIAFGVVVWGGAWLAADRTRLRHERIATLEQRARLAAAEERTRIARDLHDSAGHALNVILVHAGLGRVRATDDDARDTFATIEDVARQTVADIDQLVGALRGAEEPGVEPPPGLAALDTLLERHRRAGLDVTTTIEGEPRALRPGVDRGAYRILQEALTNSARHGRGAARVGIAFGAGALDLTVDNPVDPGRAMRAGHGLTGMRERAALLGGSLETIDRDGRFRLHARLPA
ncbi:sensor histidine kinase [Solirubrobacter soli]|uniref:sensor histidine kinase n=1 Tax=Solirubrobacter soli TaxID=363832 RepID=UPI0004049DA6|nr:histidine kinase [Solirubrobacter soli]